MKTERDPRFDSWLWESLKNIQPPVVAPRIPISTFLSLSFCLSRSQYLKLSQGSELAVIVVISCNVFRHASSAKLIISNCTEISFICITETIDSNTPRFVRNLIGTLIY